MAATNYSNGITSRGTAWASGVTAITGAGTVTTWLDSVSHVVCSLAVPPGTAGGSAASVFGTAHTNAAGAATFILRTRQSDGTTAGTVSQNVAWQAFGAAS